MNSTRQPTLILASASPRRRALLEQTGYTFEVVTADEDAETGTDIAGLSPPDAVRHLANAKADSVVQKLSRNPEYAAWTLVAADTVADLDGEILGKPADRDHAKTMLQRLNGRRHRVHTGVAIRTWQGRSLTDVATTTMFMQAISEKELNRYLDSNKWQGKAGAFGYQDGWDWLDVIEGSESNVVGLPLELLVAMLKSLE